MAMSHVTSFYLVKIVVPMESKEVVNAVAHAQNVPMAQKYTEMVKSLLIQLTCVKVAFVK